MSGRFSNTRLPALMQRDRRLPQEIAAAERLGKAEEAERIRGVLDQVRLELKARGRR